VARLTIQIKSFKKSSTSLENMESRPLDALNQARNKKVIVELKNGRQYTGTLRAFDIHINVVLGDAEEVVDGAAKRKLSVVFIRGDTIILIAPSN
jgi:small nuclear ribonucleoprotein (snRNP)-like protein